VEKSKKKLTNELEGDDEEGQIERRIVATDQDSKGGVKNTQPIQIASIYVDG